MKENYLTPENIDSVCSEIMKHTYIRNVNYNLKDSTLLVVDMQNWFVHPRGRGYIPSVAAVLPRLRALIEAYLSSGLNVVYTKHTNTLDNAGMMNRWWNALMYPDKWDTEIYEGIWFPGCRVVEKHQYDAFYGTNLEDVISTSTVVITGVVTHICCDSTARGAFMRNILPLLCVDCTASYNLEMHRSAVVNLSHAAAVPVMSAELMEELNV